MIIVDETDVGSVTDDNDEGGTVPINR